MSRQSITFTAPNDSWLSALVESKEYNSKSEIINELIRKARAQRGELDSIRAQLIKAETSGFVDQTADSMKAEFKAELRRDGKL